MTNPGTVTAVIPTWNRSGLLRAVLADLAAQRYPIERTIVVDDGGTDDSAAVAKAAGAEVIRLPRNQGFAHAVNVGVAQARADWVLILNNDVSIGPEWLGTLVDEAARRDAWFATGKLVTPCRPEILDGAYDAICRGGTPWHCGHGRPDGALWNETRTVHLTPMAALLVRRALFERVGLLDEAFGMYLEDVDFGLRCAAAGYEGIYVPEATGTHEGSATLGAWHKATVRRMARNQMLLVKKHFCGAPRWPIVVAQLLWGLMALRRGAGWSWIRGRVDGLRLRVDAPGDWARLRLAVEADEAEILRLQTESGFDRYWRLYFALTRG